MLSIVAEVINNTTASVSRKPGKINNRNRFKQIKPVAAQMKGKVTKIKDKSPSTIKTRINAVKAIDDTHKERSKLGGYKGIPRERYKPAIRSSVYKNTRKTIPGVT